MLSNQPQVKMSHRFSYIGFKQSFTNHIKSSTSYRFKQRSRKTQVKRVQIVTQKVCSVVNKRLNRSNEIVFGDNIRASETIFDWNLVYLFCFASLRLKSLLEIKRWMSLKWNTKKYRVHENLTKFLLMK